MLNDVTLRNFEDRFQLVRLKAKRTVQSAARPWRIHTACACHFLSTYAAPPLLLSASAAPPRSSCSLSSSGLYCYCTAVKASGQIADKGYMHTAQLPQKFEVFDSLAAGLPPEPWHQQASEQGGGLLHQLCPPTHHPPTPMFTQCGRNLPHLNHGKKQQCTILLQLDLWNASHWCRNAPNTLKHHPGERIMDWDGYI